jgi:predicted dehydrogenase
MAGDAALSFINGPSGPLRAGLYGMGSFSRFLIEALSACPGVRLDAIANRTPKELFQVQNARVYSAFEDLLADPQLDLIVLATPPASHGPQTLAALTARKHVFVEKPLATTLEEAHRILETAAVRRLVVGVDYPMLYSPLVEAVALFAKSQLTGPLLRISVENIANCEGLDDNHWFWNQDISGGIFVEHGVHFFDWCGRIAGIPKRVYALGGAAGMREDRVFAAVEHASGTLATYYHAFVTNQRTERTRVVLSFESVDLILDGWIPTTLHLHGQGAAVGTTTIRRMMRRSVASVPDPSGFRFEAGDKQQLYLEGVRAAIDDTVRSIREPGYVGRNDARKTLASLEVALAARESARRGGEVMLEFVRTAARP